MAPALTYLEFHLALVVPPVALLAWSLYRGGGGTFVARPRLAVAGTALMALVAFVYTAPWDNYLISQGVWWYPDGVVLATVGHAPVGEYLFFVLQPVLTLLWLFHLRRDTTEEPAVNARGLGVLVWLGLTAAGNVLYTTTAGFYLGAILVWAAPVAALQWAVGGPHLWRVRRTLALAVAVPTAYLWLADRLAIGLGLWQFSPERTTGLAVLGLPVEEAVFFLMTNILVVQGVLLLYWVVESVADRSFVAALSAR
ncbi:MAG: lycopene cyclase domain-containing protein [Halobacteriaceae archaeon]